MKEYTIVAFLSVFLAIVLDFQVKTFVLKRKEYYLFLACILFFKVLVNGYLTGKNIVVYNSEFFLGFRFGSIPFEDFLFGFSMVTVSIICWERFKRKVLI